MEYLDYAASTPVDSKVLNTYVEITKKYYANPNSSHYLGLEAKKLIDTYTNHIASLLNIKPQEIIYTSGSTEANNLAIKGAALRYKNYGKHILISSLEHNSIVSCATYLQTLGFEIELIPVNKSGLIDIETLKSMLRPDTILVSVCTVDSELGLRQPVEDIAIMLKEYPHIIFHTDASQAIGKVPVDLSNIDLVTITPHKFYGLPGFGMLVKKQNISLTPQILGGKSTTIYRSGTPETANIAALDCALTIALENMSVRYDYVKNLNTQIKDYLKTKKNIVINSRDSSLPYTINFSVKDKKSLDIQKSLEEYDIYVSTKTSCCPIETPSKLVYALTKDKKLSSSSIRVSLSHLTTQEEITKFLNTLDIILESE